MDSLKDLLLSKNLDQPSEMRSIAEFMDKHTDFTYSIKDHPQHITISVENGKIAYLLRSKLPDLEAYAAPTKKIHIRVETRLARS